MDALTGVPQHYVSDWMSGQGRYGHNANSAIGYILLDEALLCAAERTFLSKSELVSGRCTTIKRLDVTRA